MVRTAVVFTLSTFLMAAHANTSPRVVVVPTDTGVDVEKVKKEVMIRIARPTVKWLEDALPADAPDALQRYPNECTPTLPSTLSDALGGLSGEHELYVVLPTTAKHKDLAIWRWDSKSESLLRVANPGGKPIYPVRDTPARVVRLSWPDANSRPLDDRSIEAISRENPQIEMVDFGLSFIDALLEHPNECVAEITSEMTETMRAEAAKTPDADLYVAVRMPRAKRSTLVWRWHPDAYLARVMRLD